MKAEDDPMAPAIDVDPAWRLGGVSVREAVTLTTLSRGTILARVYSGEWPVTRIGRRLILPRAFLLDLLAKSATKRLENEFDDRESD